ncbi:MAG: hypothetical protein ACYS4W_08785 [Planctomycetota bacterium]
MLKKGSSVNCLFVEMALIPRRLSRFPRAMAVESAKPKRTITPQHSTESCNLPPLTTKDCPKTADTTNFSAKITKKSQKMNAFLAVLV